MDLKIELSTQTMTLFELFNSISLKISGEEKIVPDEEANFLSVSGRCENSFFKIHIYIYIRCIVHFIIFNDY